MGRFSIIPVALLGLSVVFAGCATNGSKDSAAVRRPLPDAIAARFSPPEFATRKIDGERGAVLDASVAAADALGYAVNRFDGSAGRVSASRRQVSGFDGARQSTLEVNVSSFAPGVSQVAIVLREAVESAGWSESSGALAASALVRDRVAYDVFFERLEAALRETVVAAPAAR